MTYEHPVKEDPSDYRLACAQALARFPWLSMSRFGKGKPMAVQAQAILKRHLSLSSRHDAKLVSGIIGSRSTGKIHSLATFHKYTAALKQAGEWAKRDAGLRYLHALTPELAQQYLADRAALGISQKQLDTDRNALEFIAGRNTLARETAFAPPAERGLWRRPPPTWSITSSPRCRCGSGCSRFRSQCAFCALPIPTLFVTRRFWYPAGGRSGA